MDCQNEEKPQDAAQRQALQQVFYKYSGQRGALITVLQQAQDIFGYLPVEVLTQIGKELQIPLAKIYGVVTFYAQFHLQPRGKYIISVCDGTACHVRNSAVVLATLTEQLGIQAGETTADLRFTLETVACLGACSLAPVMTINEETYGRLTAAEVKRILALYE